MPGIRIAVVAVTSAVLAAVLVFKYLKTRDKGLIWIFAGLIVWPVSKYALNHLVYHSVNRIMDGRGVV